VGWCRRTEIGTDEEGRPILARHFDERVPAAQAAADGWHALITSRPIEQAAPAHVLLDHKGQGGVHAGRRPEQHPQRPARYAAGARGPRCGASQAAEAAANEARHKVRVRTVLRSSYSAHWRRMLSPSLGALELK